MFSTFRDVHALIFPYGPYIVIGLVDEEPANFYREKQRVAFVTGHFFYFSGGLISNLFGDYVNINMWKSDHRKA